MSAVVLETNKGKGKVRPRKSQTGSRVKLVPRIAAVSHEEAQRGERASDPKRRYPQHVTDGDQCSIPKYNVSNLVEFNKALDCVRKGLPVIIQNSHFLGDVSRGSSRRGVLGKWSYDYLSEACGEDIKDFAALISLAEVNRFQPYDEDKNVFGSYYHVREPETERFSTSFKEFAQCARKWTSRRIMLRSHLMAQNVNAVAKERPTPKARDKLGSQAVSDLEGELAWEWLNDEFLKPCKFGGVFQVQLTCAMRDALLPAHYIGFESLEAQVTGRRRVLLMEPSQSFQGLYPYPLAHTYDRYSMVDFDAPNYDNWPNFSRVKGQVGILEPGDVLYCPMWWWRQSHCLEDECTSLEFALHQGVRYRTAAMAKLPLGRMLETRLARFEQLRDMKQWLQIIANGEEADWINLSTPQGLKRIQLITNIRDEVELALGRGQWQEFLLELVERRLEPTPWLNVNFREPLYLKDKPVQLPDTRTDIERKFPELFYSKLTAEGYNVERTPMSVFNPQHPDFMHKNSASYKQAQLESGGRR